MAVQLARERIDSLSDVMRALAVARQSHSERMDELEKSIRDVKGDTSKRLETLEVSSKRECKGWRAAFTLLTFLTFLSVLTDGGKCCKWEML